MTVELSHPDKLLWPAGGISKADLAGYFVAVEDRLLDALRDRPVTLRQHPKGIDAEGYMRKDLPSHAPESVGRFPVYARTARRTVTYALIDNADALRWCANQNVTEFHVGSFRIDRPDRLDNLVFDLDPSADSIDAGTAALWVREALTELDVKAEVKTSGGKGLHVVVPIERRHDTPELRSFVDAVADWCVRRHPEELTTEFHKDQRHGRLYVDCTRIGIGATVIAAWSPRARPEATVSTPLKWDEVGPDLDVLRFTQHTVIDRNDAELHIEPQRIEQAIRAATA